MYLPNFLDGFDRLVAFDAETTGKVPPTLSSFASSLSPGGPWHHHRSRFRRNAARRRVLAQGRDVELQGQPGWANRPEAMKIHRIRPADLKNAPRFPTILPKVKDFVGESPIVAHAYKNERDFLNYEFARAKVIQWGESAYAEERYVCTQVLFEQLFPGASKSLTSMCDRLVLDSSERDDRHGAFA